MKVIKNKHKSVCDICLNHISINEYPYKIKHLKATYHLICFYKWLKKRIEKTELSLKNLKKINKQIKKYKTQLMLESLEENT